MLNWRFPGSAREFFPPAQEKRKKDHFEVTRVVKSSREAEVEIFELEE